jgi:hypothetical protein
VELISSFDIVAVDEVKLRVVLIVCFDMILNLCASIPIRFFDPIQKRDGYVFIRFDDDMFGIGFKLNPTPYMRLST